MSEEHQILKPKITDEGTLIIFKAIEAAVPSVSVSQIKEVIKTSQTDGGTGEAFNVAFRQIVAEIFGDSTHQSKQNSKILQDNANLTAQVQQLSSQLADLSKKVETNIKKGATALNRLQEQITSVKMYSNADATAFKEIVYSETFAVKNAIMQLPEQAETENIPVALNRHVIDNVMTIYRKSAVLSSSVESALTIANANQPNPDSVPQGAYVEETPNDATKTMSCVQFLARLLITLKKQQEAIMLLTALAPAGSMHTWNGVGQPSVAGLEIHLGGKGKYKSRKMRKMRKISRNRRRSNRKGARSTRKKQKYVKRYSMYKRY